MAADRRWMRIAALAAVLLPDLALGQPPGDLRPPDPPLHALVEPPVVVPYDTGDPEVAGFRMRLALRLTNRSQQDVNLPPAKPGNTASVRFALIGIDAKLPDGSWTPLFLSHWYGTRDMQYDRCEPLPPGGSRTFANVPGGFVLLKKRWDEVGKQPTVRLHFWLFCDSPERGRGGDGIQSVTTNEVPLRLPARPAVRIALNGAEATVPAR